MRVYRCFITLKGIFPFGNVTIILLTINLFSFDNTYKFERYFVENSSSFDISARIQKFPLTIFKITFSKVLLSLRPLTLPAVHSVALQPSPNVWSFDCIFVGLD